MTARRYRRRMPRLKAYYTVTELAELAGCDRSTMYRRLKRRGFEFTGTSVPLSALKKVLAELWESLELAREMGRDS